MHVKLMVLSGLGGIINMEDFEMGIQLNKMLLYKYLQVLQVFHIQPVDIVLPTTQVFMHLKLMVLSGLGGIIYEIALH